MICLDFRKAFDTIKRDFILYTFESFNFGESMEKMDNYFILQYCKLYISQWISV